MTRNSNPISMDVWLARLQKWARRGAVAAALLAFIALILDLSLPRGLSGGTPLAQLQPESDAAALDLAGAPAAEPGRAPADLFNGDSSTSPAAPGSNVGREDGQLAANVFATPGVPGNAAAKAATQSDDQPAGSSSSVGGVQAGGGAATSGDNLRGASSSGLGAGGGAVGGGRRSRGGSDEPNTTGDAAAGGSDSSRAGTYGVGSSPADIDRQARESYLEPTDGGSGGGGTPGPPGGGSSDNPGGGSGSNPTGSTPASPGGPGSTPGGIDLADLPGGGVGPGPIGGTESGPYPTPGTSAVPPSVDDSQPPRDDRSPIPSVPEPATLALLAGGVAAALARRGRR